MVTWVSSGGSDSIADCGPYIGPWPPLAPGKIKSLMQADYPAPEVTYITAVPDPSGDPTKYDWGNVETWVTQAWRSYSHGTAGDVGYYHFTEFQSVVLAPFLPFPGIHLFVLYRESSYPTPQIHRPDDPLALVPSTYVAGGYGPRPDPGGRWSNWIAGGPTPIRVFKRFQPTLNWAMYSVDVQYLGAVGESWSSVIATTRSRLYAAIAAGNVTPYSSTSSAQNRTSRAYFQNNADGTKLCQLHAFQEAHLLVGTYFSDPVLNSIEPVNYRDYVPLDDTANPHHYGAADPYTPNGDGYQYDPGIEPQALHWMDDSDSNFGAKGFVLNQPSGAAIPGAPMRITLRPAPWVPAEKRWIIEHIVFDQEFDGVPGQWIPYDGSATLIGDYLLDPGTGVSGTFSTAATDSRPYSRLENTMDAWVVCQPSFAFPGGPDPEIPSWVVDTPGGWGVTQYGSVWSSPYASYDPSYSLVSLYLIAQMPRWRYWIPAGGELGIRGSDRPPIIFW